MADNFADFYTNSMAPPIRLPDGSFVPAPAVQPRETPDQMYQGIYPQSDTIGRVETVNPDGSQQNPDIARVTPEGLDVRNVRTMSIDPVTNQPMSPQVQSVVAAMSGEPGSAYRGGWGSDAWGSYPAPDAGIPPQMAYGMGQEGQNQSTGPIIANPGVAAITRALAAQSGLGVAGPAAGGFLSGDPGVTDWTVANQGGGGIMGDVSQPSNLPANPPPTAYRAPAPAAIAPEQVAAVHAALMAKQQLQSPGAQAALAKGQGAYIVPGGNSGLSQRGRNGNALGENAMMPTRAMDGSVRYSYGD